MSSLRVLHVIADLDVGGAERLLVRLVTRPVPEVGHSVLVLGPSGPLSSELVATGVPIRHLNLRGAVGLPVTALGVGLAIRRALPSVVHCWMPHANLVGGVVARTLGVPVLWSVHHDRLPKGSGYGTSRAVERLNRLLSGRLPSAVVYTSERAATTVAGGYRPHDRVMIPNAAPQDAARPDARSWLRATLGVAPDTLLVGSVGRDHPQKDRVTYLKAAALLAVSTPGVEHVLAGRGMTATSRWGAIAVEHGLDVHLLGERQDALDVIAGLDVFVSSSAFGETTPLVVSEALASGVPAVVTDVGDSAAVLGPGGLAVPPADAPALAEAVAALLSLGASQRQATGAAGRDWVATHYSLDVMTARYASVYSRLSDSARR